MTYTHSQIIQRYIALRDYRSQLKKDYAALDDKAKQAMSAIEIHLLGELREAGDEGFKTEHGTAYRYVAHHVKVASQEEFKKFVLEGDRREMFYVTPYKDAALAFWENHKQAPPGVTIDAEFVLGIRRA